MFVAGFLRVCPIQLHFPLRISMLIGSWLVLFHRSTLLILSFPQIFIILLRQVLMNVCSLCVDCLVVLHVSDPYSNTFFTLVLKMRNLVLIDMFFELQIFLCTSGGVHNVAQVCECLHFLEGIAVHEDGVAGFGVDLDNLRLCCIGC